MKNHNSASKVWHWEDIKASLHKADYSFARIARESGMRHLSTPATVKTTCWPGVQQTIADIIGVHPMEIWPSRYRENGKPLGYGIRKKRSA